MKATEVLKQQHREVDAMLETLEKSSGVAQRRTLLEQLGSKLVAHMLIEQEIFYPACAAASDDDDAVDEGYEEHAVASFELRRLLDAVGRKDEFKTRATVLHELIKHHVEEEEKEMLPEAERKLGAEKLEQLGKKMELRFEAVLGLDTARVLRAQTAVGASGARASSRPMRKQASTGARRAAAKSVRGKSTKKARTSARGARKSR